MIKVHRLVIVSLLGIAQSVAFASDAVADPSAQETWFLYEVNRARSDPPAWALEYGLDDVVGGDGAFVTLIGVAPAPPLAHNDRLADSSSFKAEEMAADDYFAHESPVGPGFLWPNELVRDVFGYPLPASAGIYSLPDDGAEVEAIAAGYGAGASDLAIASNAVVALIVDAAVPSLAHREHLLGIGGLAALFTEAGAGYGFDASATFRNYWAFHTGLTDPVGTFVTDPVETFVTGVVYDDLDGDGLYDPGEGLGGVTVETEVVSTTTNASGGYELALGDGVYRMQCLGGAYEGVARVYVTVATANRELDCISGVAGAVVDFVPVPEPGAAIANVVALLALVGSCALRRRSDTDA